VYVCVRACVSMEQQSDTPTLGYTAGAAVLSRDRLTRHLSCVLNSSVTNAISCGEVCPELNDLAFNVDKVSD